MTARQRTNVRERLVQSPDANGACKINWFKAFTQYVYILADLYGFAREREE